MKTPPSNTKAFSLIEVVMALAVFSFALTSILGLFTVGMSMAKESSDQTQAADLASIILSTRRALPSKSDPSLPIPPLTSVTTTAISNNTPIVVGINGTTDTSHVPFSDIYNLNYRISPGATTDTVNIYLLIWWPAGTPPAINNPGRYYEISTEMAR